MDGIDSSTAEELVRRHTPELVPQPGSAGPLVGVFASVVTAAAAYLALTVPLLMVGVHAPAVNLIVSSMVGIAGGVGVHRFVHRDYQNRLRRFSDELRNSPWRFYEAVASKFVTDIESQRARTIGPESEWGQARLRLESAAQEADRSVAYWTQRLAREPHNEIAQTQITGATQLSNKFHMALSGLDQRARLLVAFFNDCEARVTILQSTKRDFEEIAKLRKLTDESDDIVMHAQDTLASIGVNFVSEALRVAEALGGLERVGLVNLAGEVSIDYLETFADRIVESAERDRITLEEVARSI